MSCAGNRTARTVAGRCDTAARLGAGQAEQKVARDLDMRFKRGDEFEHEDRGLQSHEGRARRHQFDAVLLAERIADKTTKREHGLCGDCSADVRRPTKGIGTALFPGSPGLRAERGGALHATPLTYAN